MRLTEIASNRRGKRVGVVVAGKLRAAPYVTGAPTGGVFVIAGVSAADAEEIARSLGPPAPTPTAALAAAAPPNRTVKR
jgi:preprotein translocase subunit SecD